MAAYGKGQMLGSGINPESFKQDYSGFANAAAIQAQGLSNLGQSIGGAIQDYSKAKEQQRKIDAMNKAASKAIESAITLGKSYEIGGVEETLQPFLAAANDPNLSPIEKAALLDEGKAMIPNVFGRFDKNQAALIEQAQNETAAARAAATSNRGNRTRVIEKAVVNGVPVEFPVFVDPNNPREAVYSDGSPVFPQFNTQSSNVPATAPSPAAGINSALKLTGNLKADANAINNAMPLPDDFIYTADGSPGSLPPVGTPVAGADASLLPPKPSDVTPPPAVPVLGNNATQGTIRQLDRMPPGAVPIKEQEEGQIMTEKEVIELISKGFKISGRPAGNGKIFVTSQDSLAPQKGEEIIFNADGTVTKRDISLDRKEEELEKTKRASEFEETRQTNFIIDKANEAEEIIDYSISTYGPGTLLDIAKSTVPGTQEYKLKNQILPAIKDSIALSSLRQLKAASPTGASGLGSLTEKEGKRLENMYGVLDVGGDKATLKNDIKRLKQTVFDYIHGSKIEREKALANGDITKDQNDQVEQMYREQILGVTAPTAAPSGTGVGLSPEAQDILKELNIK